MQTMRNFGHKAARCAALALLVSVLSSQSAFAQGRPEIVWVRGSSSSHAQAVSPNSNLVLVSPSIFVRERWILNRLWDGQFIRTIRWNSSQGVLTTVPVFTPDGSLLAAAGYTISQGNTVYWIKFWRVSDDSIVRTITINGQASRIIFSPRGDLVAAVMPSSGVVTVWRISDGTLAQTLQPTYASLSSAQVRFSPDGRLIGILVPPSDGFRCWRVSDWTELYTILRNETTYDFALSNDGQWLATLHFGNVKIRNSLTGNEISTINLRTPMFDPQMTFISNNTLMIVARYFNLHLASLWRIPEGTLISEYSVPQGRVHVLSQSWAMSGGSIWRLSDGTIVRRLPSSSPGTFVASVQDDPRYLFTSVLRSVDAIILRSADGSLVRNISSIPSGQVTISPNGTLAAGSTYYTEEVSVDVYDTLTGERLYTVDTYFGGQTVEYGEATGLSFSRDSTLLAICGYNSICTNYDYYNNYCYEYRFEDFAFWVNAANGSRVGSIQDAVKPTFLKFAPNNTIAASDGPNYTIRIWSIPSGNLLRTLTGHTGWVNDLTFSPSGAILASASEDRTIRLWNTSNWSHIRTLSGHTDTVRALTFSPDGSLLASVGSDDTIRIWRVSDGALLRTYTDETYDVTSIAWVGDLIVYARKDGLVFAARERAGRRERLPVIAR